MSVQQSIETKLQDALAPDYLQVDNESHNHGGPATESHFKVSAVSDEFEGLMLIKRHRRIYALLAEEMAGPVHALTLHLYTPAEWRDRQQVAPVSPDCQGGSTLER